jgi:hypothetical protein
MKRLKRFFLYNFILCGICFPITWAVASEASALEDEIPFMIPFLVDAVRQPIEISGQLLVYNSGSPSSIMRLISLRMINGGVVLAERKLSTDLHGDPRYGEVNALVERLPRKLTGLNRARFFAPEGAPEFSGSEVDERYREIAEKVAVLRSEYSDRSRRPFVQLNFLLPLQRLFSNQRLSKETVEVVLEVRYKDSKGAIKTLSTVHHIRLMDPLPEVPVSLLNEFGNITLHAGDLHVHSCHGEALDACFPSENCIAETLQLSGSFTFAQLEDQYKALGLDWFTATDHSYCINDEIEYQIIADEVADITNDTFIAYPDTELSNREEGSQTGGDIGDLLCLGQMQANHMGAHGINSYKPGGDDGFLGFCSGLDSFIDNVALIRAEGGYPIINHPASDAWGWNSIDLTGGIESNMLHGVEIWNGSFQSGQGGHVKFWTDMLLSGRILYAYSGSDTHDAAFAFGANHVLLQDAFNPENLKQALKDGRVFISNGHLLIITLNLAGQTLLMGDRHFIPSEVTAGITGIVNAHYDFGEDTSLITIFRGLVGTVSEEILCISGPLSGSGVFTCEDNVSVNASSYYRAYSEDSANSKVTYTNPVFLHKKDAPTPDVKANGSDGPVTIDTNDTLSVTLELDAGSHTGDNADWWIIVFYYDQGSGSWIPVVIIPFQLPLFDLPVTEILNTTGLSQGWFFFIFGVDMNPNGVLDAGYYDFVLVGITP